MMKSRPDRNRAWRVMALVAVVLMAWHFGFGMSAAQHDAAAHGEPFVFGDFLIVWLRDTFENLQSEFWQLAVQFAVIAGVLRALGVTAYEEDQEAIKAELAAIRRSVNAIRNRTETPG